LEADGFDLPVDGNEIAPVKRRRYEVQEFAAVDRHFPNTLVIKYDLKVPHMTENTFQGLAKVIGSPFQQLWQIYATATRALYSQSCLGS
jgi:hypothetical protein